MASLFGGGGSPAPQAPPPVPTTNTAALAAQAQQEQMAQARSQGGRSSTMLTGGQGLLNTGTTSTSSTLGGS